MCVLLPGGCSRTGPRNIVAEVSPLYAHRVNLNSPSISVTAREASAPASASSREGRNLINTHWHWLFWLNSSIFLSFSLSLSLSLPLSLPLSLSLSLSLSLFLSVSQPPSLARRRRRVTSSLTHRTTHLPRHAIVTNRRGHSSLDTPLSSWNGKISPIVGLPLSFLGKVEDSGRTRWVQPNQPVSVSVLTLSKPGFFWAPKTKGGAHCAPPP